MEFLLGLFAGWFTAPFVLWGGLCFVLGFPLFFWGYDIYEDRGWDYGFWRTIVFIFFTIVILNFTTPFNIPDLITANFWTSVANVWLYILAYIAIGLVFSYVRFFFYAREYRKRMDERLSYYANDEKGLERQKETEYRNRLSGYGSRVSLITKWIFHWPWCLLAWTLTDLLRNLVESLYDVGRAIFGKGFGEIARSTEPQWMKDMERAENASKKK